MLEAMAEIVPSQLTSRGTRNVVRGMLGKKVTQKVLLSESQREFVSRELGSDLLKLKLEYGFDISRWNISV